MKNVKFGFLATSVAASLAFCASAQASGGGPFGGTIVGLTADPVTTTRVYAATSNGFFRSDDSGATWAVAETGLAVAHPSNGVYVTVPGVSDTISMPRSILSQVSPMTSLRSFMRWA